MARLIFHPEAKEEIKDASRFYEASRAGLGREFLSAIETAMAEIAVHPRRWPAIKGAVRRRLVKRFPYGIL